MFYGKSKPQANNDTHTRQVCYDVVQKYIINLNCLLVSYAIKYIPTYINFSMLYIY